MADDFQWIEDVTEAVPAKPKRAATAEAAVSNGSNGVQGENENQRSINGESTVNQHGDGHGDKQGDKHGDGQGGDKHGGGKHGGDKHGGGDVPFVADPEPAQAVPVSRVYSSKAQAERDWKVRGILDESITYREDVRYYCRERGYRQKDARNVAWYAALAQFPPLPPEDNVESVDTKGVTSTDSLSSGETHSGVRTGDGSGVTGIGDIPTDWVLADNASQQEEINWVSANRIRVRTGPSSVQLSLAGSPCPSWGALSWLEVSILQPQQFATISLKTGGIEGDREMIRAEKRSIAEVRAILRGVEEADEASE